MTMSSTNSIYLLQNYKFQERRPDFFARITMNLTQHSSVNVIDWQNLGPIISNQLSKQDEWDDDNDSSLKSLEDSINSHLAGQNTPCIGLGIRKQKGNPSTYVLLSQISKDFVLFLTRAIGFDADLHENKSRLRFQGKIKVMRKPSHNHSGELSYYKNKFDNALNLTELWRKSDNEYNNVHVFGLVLDNEIEKEALRFSIGTEKSLIVTLSVILEWKEGNVAEKHLPLRLCGEAFMQKLFSAENPQMDFTLLASNGAEVKCHKFILTAHSPFFAAMLSPGNETKELETAKAEMPGIGEKALNMIVEYLYGFEINEEKLMSGVALELLQNAHYYQIKELVQGICGFMLKKETSWFKTEMLLELYFFARNIKELRQLRDISLKMIVERNAEVRKCEKFKELDDKDAESLLEHFSSLGVK